MFFGEGRVGIKNMTMLCYVDYCIIFFWGGTVIISICAFSVLIVLCSWLCVPHFWWGTGTICGPSTMINPGLAIVL